MVPEEVILRRQKDILRSQGGKGERSSRARDGRSLRWEQLIRRREQLICEKVVGLSEKSYHFLTGTANTHKIL